MPGEAIGEHISLIWDGLPEAVFIKGHVSESEALSALEAGELLDGGYQYFDKERDGWFFMQTRAILGPLIQNYARWSTEPRPDGSTLTLRSYQEPGRGRFPVTCFDVLEWRKVGPR
jgi:hypothetical protein